MGAISRSNFILSALAASGAVTLSAQKANGKPLAPTSRSVRVLVLSGGTAHGAYEAGVISRLQSSGRRYDYIVGTSIGALNGAMLASGNIDSLRGLWAEISQYNVMQPDPDVAYALDSSAPKFLRAFRALKILLNASTGTLTGLYQVDAIKSVLKKYLTNGANQIADFKVPLLWTATDLSHGCAGYLYRMPRSWLATDGKGPYDREKVESEFRDRYNIILPSKVPDVDVFIESLRASSAIPGVFPPAAVVDSTNLNFTHRLVDGGVVNNTPLVLAVRAARFLVPEQSIDLDLTIDAVLIHTGYPGEADLGLRNILGIGLSCYNVMSQRMFYDAARTVIRIQQLVEAWPAGAPPSYAIRTAVGPLRKDDLPSKIQLNAIGPSTDLKGSPYDFSSQQTINWNFELGVKDVEEHGLKEFDPGPEFCYLG